MLSFIERLKELKTDIFVFLMMEGSLFFLFAWALIADIQNRRKARTASIKAEVVRGEKSMNALYVNFGIATLVFTLIVQTCEALKGNQVLFIVVNYGFLTYMFFFSSWFRNKLFFKFLNRVKKD